jgi:hypothetical protein
MPAILSSFELNDFYNGAPIAGLPSALTALNPLGKSIQKSYRFLTTFLPDLSFLTNQTQKDLYDRIGKMPIVRSFHVVSVSVPFYSFDRNKQQYGPLPRSFAEMKGDGLEVRFTFEEDDHGTIGNLINWLQRSVIDSKTGNYTPPDAIKIPLILILTENDLGIPVSIHTLHDAFFLNATSLDLDYSKGDSVKFDINFAVDVINCYYPISSAFAKLSSLI